MRPVPPGRRGLSRPRADRAEPSDDASGEQVDQSDEYESRSGPMLIPVTALVHAGRCEGVLKRHGVCSAW